jgi:hypothetical protein
MPTHLVNLDALFKRQDFEAKSDPKAASISIGIDAKNYGIGKH